jgi:dipeptidyl aminopeptidase/acylaminoacyl peptidase
MATLPYGSWPSPITSDLLVERVVRLGEVWVDGDDVYWNEGRPAEEGRQVVVRRRADGEIVDVVPEGFSARTTVHEYGGGAYTVHAGAVVFSNFDDQRLWRVDAGGGPPAPVTPEPPTRWAWRYADGRIVSDGSLLVCVRERHEAGQVVNDIVSVPVAGGDPVVVTAGRDFYAAPRPSPDGSRLAWLTWDLPDMPWDATELWVGELRPDGRLADARRVAGGAGQSITQPRWSPDGVLHWISDATGWWNLYRDGEPVAPMEAEVGGPDWVFGQSSYCFLPDGRIVAAWSEGGLGRVGIVDAAHGWPPEPLKVPYSVFGSLQPWRDGAVALAASPTDEPAVIGLDAGGDAEVLRPSREETVDGRYLSHPRPITFPSAGGREAHALYYPPANVDVEPPDDERPPLVVMSHGGPTSATSSALNLAIQFWTSRGIAVVDVNYGGSTGYGRAYREVLNGRWGIVDVDDCVHAALYLAESGEVDYERLAIRGGSAGGYTTLCALTFGDVFSAGASLYGVADLEALARDTHKFESRYLDGLVGPYPEAVDIYRERSPIHHAELISCPVILFQGLEDAVVPPAQAEVLVEALRSNRIPFAYLAFEGEQHGFRRAETIKRVIEAELWFYGRVLGFDPADDIEPVPIENEDALDDEVDEVAFDLADWPEQLRADLEATLDDESIPFEWDGDDLVVDDTDARRVEDVIDGLEFPNALEVEEDEGDDEERASELLHQLFVASDRLAGNPDHQKSIDELFTIAGALPGTNAPYGVEAQSWQRVAALTGDVVDALQEGDPERTRSDARSLRDALRPFV